MPRTSSIAMVAALVVTPADAHELPLGDGKISQAAKSGYIYSCQQRFSANAPGAHHTGPWLTGDTYDPDQKVTVDGAVEWPSRIAVSLEGGQRVVRANNLPAHATGDFPIARSDDAYRYDRNPNAIREQDILLSLPAVPQFATAPNCVPMGMIGFALSGAAFYNALDALGRDAPAYEIQDRCSGHPERNGQYHYHDFSSCLDDRRDEGGGHSSLVGYALDGFGFYGPYGENGEKLSNADLDACHGHTHTITWNGERREIYHYHFTDEYPYSLGCFRGTPSSVRDLDAASSGPSMGGTPLRQAGVRPLRRPPPLPGRRPPPGR